MNVARTENDVIVRVSDNGHGIAADQIERVREPFFSTRAEGTGLGLRIAERIAKAHSGEIRIESAEGSGTTVEVRLPAYAPTP